MLRPKPPLHRWGNALFHVAHVMLVWINCDLYIRCFRFVYASFEIDCLPESIVS